MEHAVGCHHFVDPQGNYIGSWVGCPPPEGSIEVPSEPLHPSQVWDGNNWTGGEEEIERERMLQELWALDGKLPRYAEPAITAENDEFLFAIKERKRQLRSQLYGAS